MEKDARQFAACQGTLGHLDCGLKYWRAWELGGMGATAPDDPHPEPEDWPCQGNITREPRAAPVSRNGLGDRLEHWLERRGITKERYAEIKEAFGLPPKCSCSARREWLNKVGRYLGL